MAENTTLETMAKSIDDLAGMIKDGFDEMNGRFDENERAHKEMKRDLEEIKMKFAYCAWQIDMEEVKKRVSAIEEKVGIKSQA